MFAITRFRYIEVLFHIFYYNWSKKKIVLYTEDLCRELESYRFVISRLVELHARILRQIKAPALGKKSCPGKET